MRFRLVACRYALLLFAILAGTASAQPEQHTLVLRGVPLDDALEKLVGLTDIDLIYSSSLVEDRIVYCDGRTLRLEPLLRCILADSGLDYVRTSSGTYVLIDSRKRDALFGDLAGRIVDQTTGEPLPNASVLLADASVGTTTDESGFFHVSSLLTGWHTVLVSYVGYESTIDSFRVDGGGRHRVVIAMRPKTLPLGPIVVDGLTPRLPSGALGLGTMESAALREMTSAAVPDVAYAAATLSGISVRHPLADLHIQGGGPGEHLTLLDGVPVRDPVTLGRHLSAFSPLAIERVTVHKAGFGATHGSHLSGVVRIDHDVSSAGERRLAVLADPISFSGLMQGHTALGPHAKASGMFSVRTGLWDVYRDPGLESLLDRWNTVDPILAGIWIREPVRTSSIVARRHHPQVAFSDLHAAARIDLSPFHTVDVSAYQATNRLASELVAVNAEPTDELDRMLVTLDEYDWTNWVGQVRNRWLLDARSTLALRARASSHASEYLYLSIHRGVPTGMSPEEVDEQAATLRSDLGHFVGSDEENSIEEFAVDASLSRSFSPESQVDVSLEATRIESRFRLANQFIAPFGHRADSWQLSTAVDGRWSLGLSAVLEPGLRLTYIPERSSVYAEPRLALRYDGASSGIGAYAVRLAGGLYRQYIPSFTLTSSGSTSVVPFVRFWLPLDGSLAPPASYHLSTEALVMPSEQWSLSAEVFHKWQPRLLDVDYAGLFQAHPSVRPRPEPVPMMQSDFISATSGRAYGASLSAAYAGSRLSSSVRYAYTIAERRYPNRFGGSLQPAPWSEPHRLTGTVSYAVIPSLIAYTNGEASWRGGWPLRRSYYDYLALRDPAMSVDPFSLENPAQTSLPAYYRIDVGLSYSVDFDPLQLQVRAAVLNLLNRHSVYDWSLEMDGSEFAPVARTLPGRRPAVSLRLVY